MWRRQKTKTYHPYGHVVILEPFKCLVYRLTSEWRGISSHPWLPGGHSHAFPASLASHIAPASPPSPPAPSSSSHMSLFLWEHTIPWRRSFNLQSQADYRGPEAAKILPTADTVWGQLPSHWAGCSGWGWWSLECSGLVESVVLWL